MKSKKWVSILLSLSFITVILFGLQMFYLDPLIQYGAENGIFSYYESSELYSNPGIAKNYQYDAVLVGSSMVENTNVSELDQLYGLTTVKLPYSGGTSYNFKTILNVCFKSNKNIKRVFWSLDEYALTTDYQTPRYPLPEYLYDFDYTNDLSYLLNLDVFYFYTTKNIINSIKGSKQKVLRDGSWVQDESVYSKTNMLKSFSYPIEEQEKKDELLYQKNLKDNLQNNIIPIIKDNPDTVFSFYMVPYSISYWYMEKCNGTLEASIYTVRTALLELLKYDNVEVHFFQNDWQIIENLDNYKDYTHFKPEINSYMSKAIHSGIAKLSKENVSGTLDDFYKYLISFDYDDFFKRELSSTQEYYDISFFSSSRL